MPTAPEWIVSWGNVWGALGALLLIGVAVWKFAPIAKKAVRVADLILGRPAEQGIEAQPSMVERINAVGQKVEDLDVANTKRLDQQNQQIAEIKAQVTPNHGTSAHDQITLKIIETAERIDKLESKVDAVLVHLGLAQNS